MSQYPRTLTIAGSDSGGGAGIQADLKTFSALGCYGMSAITALTAQNTLGVQSIHPIPPAFIGDQIDCVFNDIGVDAVKVGMLHSPEVIKMVATKLEEYSPSCIVLDPVMVAKSGDKLLEEDAIDALRDELIPISSLITPNLPEAKVLLGLESTSRTQSIDQEELLSKSLEKFKVPFLIKGGHSKESQSIDLLGIPGNNPIPLSADRIETRNDHGTGCTLSSAIAAELAKGIDLEKACRKGKEYLTQALLSGKEQNIGNGHGPVHHFYNFWLQGK